MLVTAQFALALPVLATAALLINSFVRLQRVDVGFDPRTVAYVRVSLPLARYASPNEATVFWRRALARLAEQPGVIAAGVNESMPPDEPADINNFDLVDRPFSRATRSRLPRTCPLIRHSLRRRAFRCSRGGTSRRRIPAPRLK